MQIRTGYYIIGFINLENWSRGILYFKFFNQIKISYAPGPPNIYPDEHFVYEY
jgi:hypothetical protein